MRDVIFLVKFTANDLPDELCLQDFWNVMWRILLSFERRTKLSETSETIPVLIFIVNHNQN